MVSKPTLGLPFEDERRVLSVTALNREARLIIESGLGQVWIEGEISNLSRPSSGHMYWSLKDARAQVRCAMFRQDNRRLAFRLENGQQVLLRGRVSLYEARGDFQIIVDMVEDSGEGRLRRRFEALKAKLAGEGLFDPERKRALPRLPRRIGVVTSRTGAALRDVLISLRRRFPAIPVLIYPTSVQGDGAPAEIRAALARAEKRAECDLIILTRGGGSLEDLWAFNDESVARAVAGLSIPVVVGVGHEVDFTIACFVADLRAPTPSQAAELAVPDAAELCSSVERHMIQLARAMRRMLAESERRHAALAHRLARVHPGVTLRAGQQRLDELETRARRTIRRTVADHDRRLATLLHRLTRAHPGVMLRTGQRRLAELEARARRALAQTLERRKLALERARMRVRRASAEHRLARLRLRCTACETALAAAMRRSLEHRAHRLRLAETSLRSLSPLATLERGYAIVARREDGRILRDPAAAPAGTGLAIRLAAGTLDATVDDDDNGSG